jgi:arsenate reductase
MAEKQRVLILCTGNSARSQMAEGLLRHEAGDRFEVFSAGVEPSHVRPLAIEAMRELGIEISAQRSKSVDVFANQEFDYVITVCDNANQNCPIFPGKTQRIHWSFEDPAAASGDEASQLNVFRRVRDQIREKLKVFTGSAGVPPANAPPGA